MEKMCMCVRLGCFVQVACLKLLFFSFSLCEFKFLLEMLSASKIPLSGLLYQSGGGGCVLCWELWPGIKGPGNGSGGSRIMTPLSCGALGTRWLSQAPHPRVTSSWTRWIPGQQPGFPEGKPDKSLILRAALLPGLC